MQEWFHSERLTHTLRNVWAKVLQRHNRSFICLGNLIWGISHCPLRKLKHFHSEFLNSALYPTLTLSCKSDRTNIGFFTFSVLLNLGHFSQSFRSCHLLKDEENTGVCRQYMLVYARAGLIRYNQIGSDLDHLWLDKVGNFSTSPAASWICIQYLPKLPICNI